MADESVLSPSEGSPAPAAAAADSHKRKLEDLELNNLPDELAESERKSNADALINGRNEEDDGGEDESETKRPRLESNGDNVSEGDGLVSRNGHQEQEEEEDPEEEEEPQEEEKEEEPEEEKKDEQQEEKEDEPQEEKTVEPQEEEMKDRPQEETELLESADTNVQTVEDQEPPKEPFQEITQDPASNEDERTEIGISNEVVQPNAEVEESSEIPREGDVPVHSDERQPGSDGQILSRKMEVPNDKVGVLIGKAGDTIRSLQDNSGAKIQIMRDADADPKSTTRPVELVGTLEDINKAERLIKDVIAEADAGGSPSLVARGFNTVQAASGGEQVEIQVPIEKVGLIIGKGGETIRNLQTRSGARIQLIQQNLHDGDQSKERTVRITGSKKQIDTAREMIKDVMNQTVRQSPLSGGYSQQGYRPRGPVGPQWGPRGGPHHAQFSGYDYPQRGPYPSQNSQYPPPSYGNNYPQPQAPRNNYGPSWEQRPPTSMHGPSPQGNYNYGQQHSGPDYGHPSPYSKTPAQPYGHGYNEPKYDNHASNQHYGHMGSQPTPYTQGGGSTHSGGYGPPQDQYGKPQPMYGMQPQVPQSQPYAQPRPHNQPGEVPYQGPVASAQSYGQNMPPPQQQSYPYPSSGPIPQSYPAYGHAPPTVAPSPAAGYPSQGAQQYGQQPTAYPQAGPTGGYSSYPTSQTGYAEQPAANNAGYGYQGPDPAYGGPAAYPATGVGQSGYAQPVQTQPGYDQSGGYGNVAAPTGYAGKSVSPQPGYPPQQYDSSQMYGAHRGV